jgi:hypothetical protein
MHQTFYVDVDEEITSIVEKLKKAQAKEIIMVVPKRALLIQSIVNLRILKKEADDAGFQLMIVTQDKLGKILVEKAGILVQQKMDNMAGDEIDMGNDDKVVLGNHSVSEPENKDMGKIRLERIGSMEYFNENGSLRETKENIEEIKNKIRVDNQTEKKEALINKELVSGIGDIKKRQPDFEINVEPDASRRGYFQEEKVNVQKAPVSDIQKSYASLGNNPYSSRDKVENFFQPNAQNKEAREKDKFLDHKVSSKGKKIFLIFGVFCVMAIIITAAYLFVPKATLEITAKTKQKSIDSEITGNTNSGAINYEERIIPVKIINVEQELSKKFDSTGDKSVSNQKARGTVTIYNEFSASPQPLVATTRLLSQDGKLFRLVNGVTVPGISKEGDQAKPGEISAEVVADETGEEFNIAPTSFTIPGFKDSGNEKYSKFYAKSAEKMTGGGSGGEKLRSVTTEDVTLAKSKILPELDDAVQQKLKAAAGPGMIFLDDAVSTEEAVYKLSNSPGEVAENFQITAQVKASAMVVSEEDIKNMAASMMAKTGGSQVNISADSIDLDFGKANANFKTGIVDIKFHAAGSAKISFDPETLKKEILGKNEEDLKAYLSSFPDIEEVDVIYWPSFISGRIPFQKRQVDIKVNPV